MDLASLRKKYHETVCQQIIRIRSGELDYPNFADGDNRSSIEIANGIIERIGCEPSRETLSGQRAGDRFEVTTKDFLSKSFEQMQHLRPGKWQYSTDQAITDFDQYNHLQEFEALVGKYKELETTLGTDYIVKPDIVIGRFPVSDKEINKQGKIVSATSPLASFSPFRKKNSTTNSLILHASVSCKWTIRSDRTQNIRTEAYNLIRNRKGNLPHVVAVTAEPLPTRIAALALGTGDLDCVYHFALHELVETAEQIDNIDQLDMLNTLVSGRRLRDISDLPLDLAV